MFGHGYFGAGYYGPGYWGPGGGTPPTPAVIYEGWKTRTHFTRERRRREEEQLIEILPVVLELIDRMEH